MKLYIIAGEASGDLHGSNLIKQLRKNEESLSVRCWGGDMMAEAGGDVVKHYRDLAFMGFVEVLMNLRTILKNIDVCKEDILLYKPDAIILIDYPGFNLRIAKWAKQQGIKVFYYISPQIWAWKQNRVHQIKANVDRMFVVLPFEQDFYKKFDCDVTFVGHPLLDVISENKGHIDDFRAAHNLDNKPLIALLPGSRKQEISVMLPIMLSVVSKFPDYQFVIAGAPGQTPEFYKTWHDQFPGLKIIFGETYKLLRFAEAGLITSGTATLEAGLFKLPQVVCYKGNSISYEIAKRIIKVKYISLVNLILDREAVKELIQHELNTSNLEKHLQAILNHKNPVSQIMKDYDELRVRLGGQGASERTAIAMLKILRNEP